MKSILTFGLLLLSAACFAQSDVPHIHYLADPEAAERPHSVDITHMRVEVAFEPKLGKVIGKVTHQFTTIQKNIDTLFFDAPDIQIASAMLDNKPVTFYSNKEGVVVKFSKKLNWDEKHSITFQYTAYPKKGIYFIGWNEPENTGTPDINYIRKQIWTQGQGVDNRYWIPMYDCMNDKFITETVVTMDTKYKVLSNGKKIKQTPNTNNTTTWHYAMQKPHAGYLLMLGIGNYEIKSTTTKRGTPVQFWYYPEFKERVELTSLHTERMIELLEDETGTPYPWGGYSQIMVQNFLYGAMENTSATVFGDFFTIDARGFKDRNYMGVNCHELTHQWFGDLITARSGNDVWLQESFATFYPKLFFRALEGEDAYQWSLRGEYNSALAQSEKDNYPVRHTKGGTTRLYPKGSAVLSMLRYQIGEENFRRFIQHYLAVNGFKNVEAWDFQKALKDKLGLNYDWFFDQWIHRGGEPHYKVSYTTGNAVTEFTIEQTQTTDGHVRCFKMPVNFAIYYKNGEVQRETIWVRDTTVQTIKITNAKALPIDFALFDEESRIMKKMSFKKGKDECMAQASKARYMIDRYDAIVGLTEVPVSEKESFLKERYKAEKYFAIRAEIARQLANQITLNDWYTTIVNDPRPEVKNAFIAADTTVKNQQAIFAALLKDSSYTVVENALDKLMKSADISTADKHSYLTMLTGIKGQNSALRVKWLEYSIQYAFGNITENRASLTILCSSIYEFRTRVNAANAVKRLNICDRQIVDNLLNAVLTYNSRLSGPCTEVLKYFIKDAEKNSVIQDAIRLLNAEQKELLKKKELI
ncbi:MAG: M1 family metallopeptidase [Bacteroidota bacterium]